MSSHITDAEVEIEIRQIYDSEAYRLGSAAICSTRSAAITSTALN